MAADPNDIFARLRTDTPTKEPERIAEQEATLKPPPASDDVFASLRVPEFYPGPPKDRTLGSEFQSGLAQGLDQMAGMGMGVVGMVGREMDLQWLEDAGNESAARWDKAASEHRPTVQRVQEIEDAGDFFKWTASALGQAVPSLTTMFVSGGVGSIVGKKAIELGVKKSIAKNTERRLRKYGYSTEDSLIAAREYMLSDTGKKAIARAAANPRTGALIAAKKKTASKIGLRTGGMAAASIPQIGAIDQELVKAGVVDPGLTALMGGVVGGALEFAPALRLMDKLFPGVDRQVSKQFVKDFAVASGTQAAIEGSTEAAQEIIQLAAHAYHDPTFDMWSNDAWDRVINAFAAGAVVGFTTGGIAATPDAIRGGAKAAADSAVGRKIKTEAPKIGAWAMDQAEKGARAAGRGVDAVLDKAEPLIGSAAWLAGEAADAARNKAEEAVQKAKEERGDTQTSFEGEGFTPADNTMWEEIRTRIYSKIQPAIESAVNSLQSQVDKASGQLDLGLEGGANPETETIVEVARRAHNDFLRDHGPRIEALKTWMDEQASRMVATLKTISDPKTRQKYIEDHLAGIKARAAPVVEAIKKAAAKRDKQTEAEIDNMEFDDDMLAQLGMQVTEEGNVVDEEGEIVDDEGVLAEVGQPKDEPVLIFGANLATPEMKVSGKEEVKGFKTTKFFNKKTGKEETSTQEKKEQVALAQLRARYPEADDDTFTLEYQPDGSSIWTAVDTTLKESQKFWRDFDAVRRSGKRPDNPRRVVVQGKDGTKFGYKYKRLELDVKTMAFRGKNLIKDARKKVTEMQGFLAMAAEMLDRGIISEGDFIQLNGAAKILLDTDKIISVSDGKTTETRVKRETHETQADKRIQGKRGKGGIPVKYPNSGTAWANLIEFKEELEALGIEYPLNEEGDYNNSWDNDRTIFNVERGDKLAGSDNYRGHIWGYNRSTKRPKLKKPKKGEPKPTQKLSPAQIHAELRRNRPKLMAKIDAAMKKRRQDEHLDKEQRADRSFSQNAVLEGPSTRSNTDIGGQRQLPLKNPADRRGHLVGDTSSGTLGDTRGDTAGSPDFEVMGRNERNTLPLRKTDPDLGPSQLEFGEAEGVESAIGQETRKSRQNTDQKTDPKNLPDSFQEDRATDAKLEEIAVNKFKVSKKAEDEGRGFTARDKAWQARYGRQSRVTILTESLGKKVNDILTNVAGYVTSKLGLTNNITVVDDGGLRWLIENNKVSDPIFAQTLNDPNVHARNIRIGDQSFVYLSDQTLSNPALTVMALGHELGHHVYRVAFDQLTPAAQQRLRDAYQGVVDKGRVVPRPEHQQLTQKLDAAKARRKYLEENPFDYARGRKELNKELARLTKIIKETEAKLAKMSPTITKRGTKAKRPFDEAGFNEWMADQFAAYLIRPTTTHGSAGGAVTMPAVMADDKVGWFFQTVVPLIQKLFDYLKNPRFQLNETYAEFVRAIEMKARETHDSSNPLHQDKLNDWFKNEGVTMRAWFGNDLESDNMDITPLTEEGQKAMARVERTYPAVAARMVSTKNFVMNAYKMLLAPSAGVMRSLAKQYPSLAPLVMVFHHQALGEAKVRPDIKAHLDQTKKDLAKRQRQLRKKDIKPEEFTELTADVAILKDRIAALKLSLRAGQNYHQAQSFMSKHFMNHYTAVLKEVRAKILASKPHLKKGKIETRKETAALDTLVDEHMRKLSKSLIKKEGDPNATFTGIETKIRDLFDTMHAYARDKGLPVNHILNYFPRQMNYALMIAGKDAIITHLTTTRGFKIETARQMYESLLDPHAQDGRATIDATETPSFIAMNSRSNGIAADPFFEKYRETNLTALVSNYANQVTKRAEFNDRLGGHYVTAERNAGLEPIDFKELIKSGMWDPKHKMRMMIAGARIDDNMPDAARVVVEKYIDANLGMLGRDSPWGSPNARKWMAGIMAYQNMRVLLFTVFASLPDLAGPVIRSNDLKLTWGVLKDHIREMADDTSALAETARAYGVIQEGLSEHIMTEYVDNHYMPPTLRKWNDNFFKYTGLNWYTNFTRKYALKVGMAYIEQAYADASRRLPRRKDGATTNEIADAERKRARAKDMLAELGLEPKHVKEWIDNERPDYNSVSHGFEGSSTRFVAEALIQFVDESIMRPNAAQRPIMASHPMAMLVFHLKSFMFAVHDVMIKRMKFNIDEAKSPADYMLALAPAFAMLALTAVGLELRELIQYAGSNRKPPTDRMDGWEYIWELAQRSGLTGISQLAIDWDGAADRGQSQVAGILGPTMGQFAMILSRPATQTVPKSIPVVSQIPALRDAVRTVM